MSGFEKIIAWQKARVFITNIYETFQDCRDYGFKDQIQRAAVSVSNNIAEGHAKRSDKSFSYFLLISKGSLAEVQSMLIIANDLGYISDNKKTDLYKDAEEIAKLTSGLIKYLKTQGS